MVPYSILSMEIPFTYAPTIPATIQKKLDRYSDVLQQLLWRRGIEDVVAAEPFLHPDYETELHDPLLLNDIEPACARIHQAVKDSERVEIFSDYDCDGIPGAVVLHDFFKMINFNNFQNYIPHRHFEGFGLSIEAIDKLAADGVKLVITIDCGTNDIEVVKHATKLGIDVIITDHHEPGETLPVAVAVVNPKLGDYPFPHLCGAGVVYKLVQALISTGSYDIPTGHEKWWLDMVGVATIADMVPLVGENRIFAHYGLTVLRKSRRPGLQKLFAKARINQNYLTEEDVGFTIGPRINAASRMDAPEHAFLMLTATDNGEASAHVDHLEKLNNERKGMVAVMTKELHVRLKELEKIPDVLVLGNPLWRPALVGLVANKLAEEYSRPVFLWGRDGNDVIKGSCRSGGGVSVVRLMETATVAFHEHGGHHMSGGFSVKDDQVFSLGAVLNEAFVTLGSEALVPTAHEVDLSLSLEAVFGEIRSALTILAPFGASNPKPLFAFESVTPREVAVFGKGHEHLKLVFDTTKGPLEAIAFFTTPTSFPREPAAGKACTILAHIEESFFMNRRQTRLRIVDIV